MKRAILLPLTALLLVVLLLVVPAVTQDRSGRRGGTPDGKPALSDWETKMFCPYQAQVEAINRIRHLGMKNEKYGPSTDMLIQFSKKSDNPAIKRMALFHASQLQEKAGHSVRAAEILIDVAKIEGRPRMGQGGRRHPGRGRRHWNDDDRDRGRKHCKMKDRDDDDDDDDRKPSAPHKGRDGRKGRSERDPRRHNKQNRQKDDTKPASATETDRPMTIFECIAAEVL